VRFADLREGKFESYASTERLFHVDMIRRVKQDGRVHLTGRGRRQRHAPRLNAMLAKRPIDKSMTHVKQFPTGKRKRRSPTR